MLPTNVYLTERFVLIYWIHNSHVFNRLKASFLPDYVACYKSHVEKAWNCHRLTSILHLNSPFQLTFASDFISSNRILLIDIDINNSQNLLVSVNKEATMEDQWMKIDIAVLSESRAYVHYLDLRAIKIFVSSRHRMKQLTFVAKSCSLNFQLFNNFFSALR